MKKTLILIVALAMSAGTIAFAGGGNILANGEIAIAATTTPSTNTQSISLSNITGKEWALVYGIRVANSTDFPVTNVLSCVDLGDSETVSTVVCTSNQVNYTAVVVVTAVTNQQKVYSGTNDACIATNTVITYSLSAPYAARDLLLTVTTPTNDAAGTVEYFIYGE